MEASRGDLRLDGQGPRPSGASLAVLLLRWRWSVLRVIVLAVARGLLCALLQMPFR